ncbi:MAG: DUF1254 domain-containing protein [Neisseriaceae bacterium]|nr:DUF1254 domain-containing protein [Neisseriaceae bacterium]
MKPSVMQQKILLSALGMAFCTGLYAKDLPTNGIVHSPMGDLELQHGYPTPATVKKVYDNVDFQRASEAYLWALPMMGMVQWQDEQKNKFGAGNLDFVDYLTFTDKLGLLTANATTPYLMAFPNLDKSGPLVLEVPAGMTAGGMTDFWQRPISDTGQTGPDKGKGGKYLILGPNDPDMKVEGYYVVRSPTANLFVGQRTVDPDRQKALALMAGFRLYPYSQINNPPATKHIKPDGRKWSGTQPRGLAYWEGVSRFINEEPVHERDRMILAMLKPLGIEKGKPFNPNARQKQILIDGAQAGEIMARTFANEKRFEHAVVWPSKRWELSLNLKETNQENTYYTEIDERSSWFYEAVGVSEGMMGHTVGLGQVYLESAKDGQGNWLDGSKNYTLRVPANAPVSQFWSFTVYDNETRCFVDTGVAPDRSSRDNLVKNADGSVDLYFGPQAPVGKPIENWIKTIPGKGWFTYFRLYGPTQSYLDRSWVLNDIQAVK